MLDVGARLSSRVELGHHRHARHRPGQRRAVVGPGVARRGRDEHPAVHQRPHRRGQRVRPAVAPRHHRHRRPLRVARDPVDPRQQRREPPRAVAVEHLHRPDLRLRRHPVQPRRRDPGDDGAVAVAVAGRAVDGVERRLRAAPELGMRGVHPGVEHVDGHARAGRLRAVRGRRAAERAGRSGRAPSSRGAPRPSRRVASCGVRAARLPGPARRRAPPGAPARRPAVPAVERGREPGERAAEHRWSARRPRPATTAAASHGVRVAHDPGLRLRGGDSRPRQCRDQLPGRPPTAARAGVGVTPRDATRPPSRA